MSPSDRPNKFEEGDIVAYDPPDLTLHDYARNYLHSVGIVTNKNRPGASEKQENETNVMWLSCPELNHQSISRHYTKNLRLLGHITIAPEDVPV